jgi:hypothetical protein
LVNLIKFTVKIFLIKRYYVDQTSLTVGISGLFVVGALHTFQPLRLAANNFSRKKKVAILIRNTPTTIRQGKLLGRFNYEN